MLERQFKHLKGLGDFSADVIARRLHVKYDGGELTASAIADAVADTGMRAWLESEELVELPRWMAVVADTGASILVVANALRLLRAD